MLQVELLTGTQRRYAGQAEHVVLPGEDGELSVLDCHAPMVCALSPGVVHIDDRQFPIDGGVVSVWRNHVVVLGD